MTNGEFNKLHNQLLERVSSEVADLFHRRAAGYPLKECLVESKLSMSVLLIDDLQAMNYSVAPNTILTLPASVKCSDISITLNKIKSYVFKRH